LTKKKERWLNVISKDKRLSVNALLLSEELLEKLKLLAQFLKMKMLMMIKLKEKKISQRKIMCRKKKKVKMVLMKKSFLILKKSFRRFLFLKLNPNSHLSADTSNFCISLLMKMIILNVNAQKNTLVLRKQKIWF